MANTYRYTPLERVYWDTPAAEVILKEVEQRDLKRVFVVSSSTLSKETEEINKIKKSLGKKFVGLFDRCLPHSPQENVIECVKEVKSKDPDIIVTIGGGTPIDTVKVVQLCVTLEIETVEELRKIAHKKHKRVNSKIRQIAVPTTLSGGEYSNIGGAMDTDKQLKERYIGDDLCPQTVVLDPNITIHTPQWLWLSTAIRSVDHAIEGFCSGSDNPLIPPTCLYSLKLFAKSLRDTYLDPENIESRSLSQKAVWIVAKNLGNTTMGASHGIGYLLGSIGGVPHGYTSCVMLPAVLKWNESHQEEQHKIISDALGRPKLKAWKAVKELVTDLGLPSTLDEVGIKRDQWKQIIDYALKHPTVLSNPKPIKRHEDVMEILEFAEN